MGKQIDYPADTVGIDGTVYPTVGENIRHIVPLKKLKWTNVTFNVTKGVQPESVNLNGSFCGLFYVVHSSPTYNLIVYHHILIYSSGAKTILFVQPSLYNNYSGKITISLLMSYE